MTDPAGFGLSNPDFGGPSAAEARPRPVGAPLPVGGEPQSQSDGHRPAAIPPPGRALTNTSAAEPPLDLSSALQRAFGALRTTLPFVQRLLPLLEGNLATTVSSVLAPHPPTPPPAPPVDLEPIENSLVELHAQHRDLRNQIVDQNSSIKRVEDQLEMVREATDRNTLEQQELLEDLRAVGNKVNMFALFALGLLVVSIILNVVLYLHIQRVLP